MNDKDRERLKDAKAVLGGDEERLKALTERHLGTRDLDEADRRTRVVWEWESEHGLRE